MLSACIPNAAEFAAWVGRIRDEIVYVIETSKRVVPLEYYLCENEDLKCIKKEKGAKDLLTNKKKVVSAQKNIAYGRKKDNLLYITNFIVKNCLSPAIIFCFSKKKCHENAKRILKPFLNEFERKQVIEIFKNRFEEKIPISERSLPQIDEIKGFLINGIGIHHSGLLSILKELVEILFAKNLIKILFATETFSMGVNFPAKSVVFLSLKKMDDQGSRILNAGEFMQMSGRAGRRGVDTKGIVIVNYGNEKYPSNIEFIVQNLINSSTYLHSRFKLTFNMILQLLRSKMKIEDILRCSFCEENVQKKSFEDLITLDKLQKLYKEKTKISSESQKELSIDQNVFSCQICHDIEKYALFLKEFYAENNDFIIEFLRSNVCLQDFYFVMNDSIEIQIEMIQNNILKLKNKTNAKHRTTFSLEDVELEYLYKNYVNFNKKKFAKEYKSEDIFYIKKDGQIFLDYTPSDCQRIVKLAQLKESHKLIKNFTCLKCPIFNKHYNEMLESLVLKDKIDEIVRKFDDKSLSLFRDYFQKIEFLKSHNYIDNENNVLLKGRIGCEIRTVNEIIITEIIINNMFADFNFAEMMGFISGFIVKEESSFENDIKVNNLLKILNEIMLFKYFNAYYFPIKEWCESKKLGDIVRYYGVSEGVMVRTILRLEEFCREIKNICVLVNDNELDTKIEAALAILRRDIVQCPSLYFDD